MVPGSLRSPQALVLTDQLALANALELALNHGAYLTRVAQDMQEAAAMLRERWPHVAIVDVDAGEEILERFVAAASEEYRIPFVALTRRTDLNIKLEAFNRGADDILTLPFAPEELLARVMVITRRTYGAVTPLIPVLRVHELEINIMTRRVRLSEEELHLTSLELALLYLLAGNAGRTMSRDEIISYLWGTDYLPESNLVDRHIRSLRLKLRNDYRRPRYIFTVPGVGYRFAPPNTGQG